MGLPEDYELPKNYNEAYHLAGDGVVVPVIRAYRGEYSGTCSCRLRGGRNESGLKLMPAGLEEALDQFVFGSQIPKAKGRYPSRSL